MALSPQAIRETTFKTVKRGGVDPDEVDAFKHAAAEALQQAMQNGTAMEARARAAVARLQELSQQSAAASPPEADEAARAPREPTADESEAISRTLLLAQRTADATIADAEREAAERRSAAEEEVTAMLEAAKADAHRAGESELVRVQEEVQSLLARRDFLESDVELLDQHVAVQRERITEVVAQLEALTNRVPNGLADMRRPQLSASDHGETPPGGTAAAPPAAGDDTGSLDVGTLIDETVAAGADGSDDADAEVVEVAEQAESAAGPPHPETADGSANRHTLFAPDED